MARMILSTLLCSSCLPLAVADILSAGSPWGSEDSCAGTLILTSAEVPALTRTFSYVEPSPTCQTANIKPSFKISRAEVQGCGTFILYTRKNGRGGSQDIMESYGPLTAAQMGISTVKSIEGTGCFQHQHSHKGIKEHIEKRADDPWDVAGGYFSTGKAQDQFQNKVNKTEGSDSACQDCKYKTTLVVTVLVALSLFVILGILVYSKHRARRRYFQP